MKYKILKNQKINDAVWLVELKYWKGCQCTSQIKKIEIHQETRPSLQDAINHIN